MDGAQLVDGEWWHPVHGCDSLSMFLNKHMGERLSKYRIEKVTIGGYTYYRPAKKTLFGLLWVYLDPTQVFATYEGARYRILESITVKSPEVTYLDPKISN